jgi:predicted RecB family nuclease
MRNVTKEIFLNARMCPTLGWLLRSGKGAGQIRDEPLTLNQKFRLEQGIEIGERARQCYPHGLLIDTDNIASAVQRTKDALKDPGVSVMFEATFLVDGFVTRADILKRQADGWELVEIKSGVNDKPEYVEDMAYTAMVIGRWGLEISDVSLWLISKDYRLGMSVQDLFVEINHRDQVLSLVEEFGSLWQQIDQITASQTKPEPKPLFECRKCEQRCQDVENHILNLPRLNRSKFDQLAKAGILSIEDIPDDFALSPHQARVKHCVQTNALHVGKNLAQELERISWPAHYLDFETVVTAIPLYPGIAPYTQIPTQYSVHKYASPGNISDHREYLADPRWDCRLELAENLIDDLSGAGSIVAYSSFEKTIIKGLVKLYPYLSADLEGLIERLVDLRAIISKNLYHPAFQGSTSIKSVLPALIPDMSYAELSIQDGDSAMATFAYLALGKYTGAQATKTKQDLLDYCRQDTLAMVKLHERLAEYA